MLAALVASGEALAATDETPGPARLWAHEEGEALAATLAAALAALDQMGEGGAEGPDRLAQRRGRLARNAARLIVEAALYREESRGAHHRGDFPTSSDRWRESHVMRAQRGVHLERDPAAHH